jgi:predicted RNA-binding Zn-ribbon protein involved in translation (DUF1610 family)
MIWRDMVKTAEWICPSCGATNRKLVRSDERRTEDRCVSCHRKHVIEEDTRPVRWRVAYALK